MDRRTTFFVLAAATCFALVPVTFADHRWVPVFIGVLYVLLALGAFLDAWSRRHRARR